MKKSPIIALLLVVILLLNAIYTKANGNELDQRMKIYKEYASATNVPWYMIAAIDQFERNTKTFRDDCPKEDTTISVCFSKQIWSGSNNPKDDDNDLVTIRTFHGIGADGNRDGKADRLNPDDALTALLNHILMYGTDNESVNKALLSIYRNEKTVSIIMGMSKIYEKYNTLALTRRVYPIPKGYNEDMVSNYGAVRGYKGVRSHEGVDIFANYGVPIVSTAYGIVEIKGWNELGGYRIGIRDLYGTYEYYAHLLRFAKDIKEGDIVEAGQLIGYVGASGYGKEGTSGKFPPHLHFGFYKYDGRREWPFNPYSYLVKWEYVRLK